MENLKSLELKKATALFFSILSILAIFVASTTSVVAAAEVEKYVEEVEVYNKNEQWIALENEVSSLNFRIAIANEDVSDEQVVNYLFEKYDGAAMISTRGHGQRLQNGGWNTFYNTAASKQQTRTGYNSMYAGWLAGAALSEMITLFSAAFGVSTPGAVIAFFAGLALTYFAQFAKGCRDNIDAHGNVGTARITLTEHRWSSNYDNFW